MPSDLNNIEPSYTLLWDFHGFVLMRDDTNGMVFIKLREIVLAWSPWEWWRLRTVRVGNREYTP